MIDCLAYLFVYIIYLQVHVHVTTFCRINLFYDVAYCISLECCDFEEDVAEIITRLQTLASNLTTSHEVPTSILFVVGWAVLCMQFRRGMHPYLYNHIYRVAASLFADKNSLHPPPPKSVFIIQRFPCCFLSGILAYRITIACYF